MTDTRRSRTFSDARSRLLPLAVLAGAVLTIAAKPRGQITPTLLANLETGTEPASSSPEFGAELSGRCIFAATTRSEGRELFVRDAAGIRLLKDIFPGIPGSNPTGFTVFAGRVWFRATDPTGGTELWATDGTTAGTVRVVDLVVGPGGSAPGGFTVCSNRMFFTAFADGHGREPHVTDGTAAGTRMVVDIAPGFETSTPIGAENHVFACCNNQAVFFADDGVHGLEPWASDGTALGTRLIVEITPNSNEKGPDPSVTPVCCNGHVFFVADDRVNFGVRLWSTDGTAANTQLVALTGAGSLARNPSQLTCVGNLLFFVATRSGIGTELWRSDGTANGTLLVKDILAGSSSSFPADLTACNGTLFLSAQGDFTLGRELFRSDGTEAGTFMVADIRPGLQSSFPSGLICCGNRVIFRANDGTSGDELFISDGTAAGTTLLADLEPGSSSSQIGSLVCCGPEVLFAATVAGDREAYASDGTSSGTRRLADIEPAQLEKGSAPAEITAFGPRSFYFVATTTATGRELFFFDGRTNTTTPIELIPGPDGGDPRDLRMVGRRLFFTATTPATGRELFAVRGTSAPQLVADLVPGSSTSFPSDLTDLAGQHLLLSASIPGQGTELVSVSSRDLSVRSFDLRPGSGSSSPNSLNVIHGATEGQTICIFSARDDTHGVELFASDGLTAQLAIDANPGTSGSFPNHFVVNGDGTELTVTVDDTAGTRILSVRVDEVSDFFLDIQTLANLFQSFVVKNFFKAAELAAANIPTLVGILAQRGVVPFDSEFYGVDGTTGNVRPFATTRQGARSGEPDQTLTLTNSAIFRSDDGVHGREASALDPTNGQITISDIRPGSESSKPEVLGRIDNTALVSASPQTDGLRKLFALGGGAGAAREIVNADVKSVTQVGADFVAVVEDLVIGEELYRLPNTPAERLGSVTKDVGAPCDGFARTSSTKARIGAQVTWTASGGKSGTIGIMLFGSVLDQAIELAGGCDVWLDPTQIITVALFTPPLALVNVQLPPSLGLIGAEFTIQTVWIDTASNGIVTSNAVVVTID